jgi:hypothetical protein
MTDPFNQLPTPPEFVSKLDAVVKGASHVLGCSVVMVAIQENGKLAVCIEAEEGSEFAKLLDETGVPMLLHSLALMTGAMDANGMAGLKS